MDYIERGLRQWFGGVIRLKNDDALIQGVISGDNEYLPFAKTVYMKDGIEVWFNNLQEAM